MSTSDVQVVNCRGSGNLKLFNWSGEEIGTVDKTGTVTMRKGFKLSPGDWKFLGDKFGVRKPDSETWDASHVVPSCVPGFTSVAVRVGVFLPVWVLVERPSELQAALRTLSAGGLEEDTL